MSIELDSESVPTPTSQAQERSNSRCALLLPCCFGPRRRSSWWELVRSNSNSGPSGERWWSRGLRALKKIREWSEIVAGPRWKTFIRRFNRNRASNSNSKRTPKYQYDPLSYALNFDEGHNGDFNDEATFRNFSTRYAAVNVKSLSPKARDIDDVVLV